HLARHRPALRGVGRNRPGAGAPAGVAGGPDEAEVGGVMETSLVLLDFPALVEAGPLATVGRVLAARADREFPEYARVWEAEVMADRLCHVRSAAACLFNVMPPFTLPMIVRGALPAIRRDGPERLHLPWLLVFYAHLVHRFWGKLCA